MPTEDALPQQTISVGDERLRSFSWRTFSNRCTSNSTSPSRSAFAILYAAVSPASPLPITATFTVRGILQRFGGGKGVSESDLFSSDVYKLAGVGTKWRNDLDAGRTVVRRPKEVSSERKPEKACQSPSNVPSRCRRGVEREEIAKSLIAPAKDFGRPVLSAGRIVAERWDRGGM